MTPPSQQPDRSVTPDRDLDRHWSTLVLRNRRLLILIVALIAVAGGSSFFELPRMEDPVLRRRVALVNTFLPGADAERVETLISEKIEDELRDIEQIKELRSVSRLGVSTVSIELLDSVDDTDSVWSRVRSRIDDAVPRLPANASRPVFEELEVRAFAMLTAIVWQSDSPADWTVLRRLAIDLQDRMQGLAGTDKVERFGDPGEEIVIEIDPAAIASLGLTLSDVVDAIGDFDAKQSAGQVRPEQMQIAVEVGNQFRSADELAVIPIAGDRDVFATLGDVATIRSGAADPLPRSALVDGKPAVVLGAMVRPSYRIDRWTDSADDLLDRYAETLPSDIGIDFLLRQTKYVDQRLSSLVGNLFAGAAAVAVVVWLLMGFRATILVLIALPLSSLMVLFGLRILGIPIHQMSITGLIISLGLLIDNAIVIVDEVKSRIRAAAAAGGERQTSASAMRAAAESIRHLAVPLLGSTITTALAFAPIALMPGPAGEFVGAIAISVILAIFSSLFLAMTVIPALAVILFPDGDAGSGTGRTGRWLGGDGISIPPLARLYRRVLRQLIGKPWLGISISMAAPIAGFFLASGLEEQFFPASGRDQFYVTIEGPVTSSVAATKQTAARVDRVLRGGGAKRVDWFFGESAPQFYYNVIANRRGVRNFGQALVTLRPGLDPTTTIATLQADLRARITDSRVLVRQLEQGPPFEAPIEVRLFGPDLAKLRSLGDEVRRRMLAIPDVTYCRADASEVLPVVSLDVDPAASRMAGISPSRVAEEFRISLDGAVVGSVLQGNEDVPVMVRIENGSRGEIDRITTMELMPDMGDRFGDDRQPSQNNSAASQFETSVPAAVPLTSIASVNLVPKSAALIRLNRQRLNEVAGYLSAGVLPSVVQRQIEASLVNDPLQLPPGYELRYGGSASKRDDAVGNLFSTVGVLTVLMIATLVLSLGSFQSSIIIGAVALLSIGLGLLSLVIGGYSFGFMSIIGTMGLIGVAINDSIVVMATLDSDHGGDHGGPESTAFEPSQTGSPASFPTKPPLGGLSVDDVVDRVLNASRHVIATTLTTMAGFAPLIIDGGGFWPPMAICVAGGVAGATVLALVFVPAAQVAFAKIQQKTRKTEFIVF